MSRNQSSACNNFQCKTPIPYARSFCLLPLTDECVRSVQLRTPASDVIRGIVLLPGEQKHDHHPAGAPLRKLLKAGKRIWEKIPLNVKNCHWQHQELAYWTTVISLSVLLLTYRALHSPRNALWFSHQGTDLISLNQNNHLTPCSTSHFVHFNFPNAVIQLSPYTPLVWAFWDYFATE